MIAAVVCVDEQYGIGYKGSLLTNIPDDMKNFKKITTGGSVIMGRKTYNSLPKKPLPKRENIVITKKVKYPKVQKEKLIFSNMSKIKIWLANDKVIKENNGIYICGGESIYNELLSSCERVYLTKVFKTYKADKFFPKIDEMPEWYLSSESEIKKYKDIQYQFCTYDRIDYTIHSVQEVENTNSPYKFDMVITVKTFNSYQTVVLQFEANDRLNVYADTWDYLDSEDNILKFIDKVKEYNDAHNNKGE